MCAERLQMCLHLWRRNGSLVQPRDGGVRDQGGRPGPTTDEPAPQGPGELGQQEDQGRGPGGVLDQARRMFRALVGCRSISASGPASRC